MSMMKKKMPLETLKTMYLYDQSSLDPASFEERWGVKEPFFVRGLPPPRKYFVAEWTDGYKRKYMGLGGNELAVVLPRHRRGEVSTSWPYVGEEIRLKETGGGRSLVCNIENFFRKPEWATAIVSTVETVVKFPTLNELSEVEKTRQ